MDNLFIHYIFVARLFLSSFFLRYITLKRRVVITGLGAVTPLANTVADTWAGIINGKSGIGAIDSFNISPFATTFGGVIRNLDIGQYIP